MKAVFMMGASGVGKTTLTKTLSQHYTDFFGGQDVVTVNLDCANFQESADVNICDLITLEDIMQEYELGPNGALLYSADFLFSNIEWLYGQIQAKVVEKNPSFTLPKQLEQQQTKDGQFSITLFFDLPGQIQLYLQSQSMLKIVTQLTKRLQLRCCLLQLFDATYIYQVNDFVSMCMVALTTGINFQMPQINLMHKIDVQHSDIQLMKNKQPAYGMLEDYLKVTSLTQMGKDLRMGQAPLLNKIEEVVDQYGRVSFAPCSVKIPDLILFLIFHLQKIFGTLESNVYANKGFALAMKPFLRSFADQRMINDLEAQLFGQDETDWEAEIAQIRARSQQKQQK